ncbi:hypothetical protein RRG08_034828 [Elysia crispata]|uniref:Uncharacterized protein n=1 Tax=Elysia crispata TaxID=231223 RepID=A0AAE1ALT8_9GAST|nr:hypothetical protein RRG08_034828 [Elysia crispata]
MTPVSVTPIILVSVISSSSSSSPAPFLTNEESPECPPVAPSADSSVTKTESGCKRLLGLIDEVERTPEEEKLLVGLLTGDAMDINNGYAF